MRLLLTSIWLIWEVSLQHQNSIQNIMKVTRYCFPKTMKKEWNIFYFSTVNQNASFMKSVSLNRWHKLMNASSLIRIMYQHYSVCAKYYIDSCRQCSSCSMNFVIALPVPLDKRNIFNPWITIRRVISIVTSIRNCICCHIYEIRFKFTPTTSTYWCFPCYPSHWNTYTNTYVSFTNKTIKFKLS